MRDLINYLKAMFAEGRRSVLTAFDIVGMVLFFFPKVTQKLFDDELSTRIIGGLIFCLSFVYANFLLYKKLSKPTELLNEKNLSLYPYRNPPYNAVEMKYVGPEPIQNLDIALYI